MDGSPGGSMDGGAEGGISPDGGDAVDSGAGVDAGGRVDSGADDDAGGEDVRDSGPGDADGCFPNPFGGEICPTICPEVCDGIDNDCSGEVDDHLDGLSEECGTDVGECQKGHTECVDGLVQCVGGVSPEAEKCDHLDNNCDGATDDGYPDADGDGAPECTTTDNDAAVVGPFARKRITVNAAEVDDELTDFPVLVRIPEDEELVASRADGKDIYFTQDDGETVLDAEIEYWQQSSGALVAWVRIPTVSSDEDTAFYLYYGDETDHSSEFSPQGVWDDAFEGVWHLSSDADATRYGRDGTNNGTTDVDGLMAGARSFDDRSHIYMGQGLLPGRRLYTISAWVRPDLSDGDDNYGVLVNGITAQPYEGSSLYLRRSDGAVGVWNYTSSTFETDWAFSPEHEVSDDSWAFVAVTTEYGFTTTIGSLSSSINGRPWSEFYAGPTTDGPDNGTESHLNIGRFEGTVGSGGFHFYQGIIDEVRVSSTRRSSAWIKAEYENQRDGSTFLTIEAD